jgi:hypothetical protein
MNALNLVLLQRPHPGERASGTLLQTGRFPDVTGFSIDLILNPSSRTMPLGSTHLLTEISIRNLPGDNLRLARTTVLSANLLENVGVSTSHTPMGLDGLLFMSRLSRLPVPKIQIIKHRYNDDIVHGPKENC